MRTSILNYGMPDLSPFSLAQRATTLASIARTMEELIRRFEPRLRPGSVKVDGATKPVDDATTSRAALPHRRGALHVDPVNEPVSFDTDVDLERGRISVRGDL